MVGSICVDGKEGDRVEKGDPHGYFQFGGSTYCLVFGPNVITDFALPALPHPGATVVPVRSHLATVRARP
jgi:phosphatidylserine decarboxylase